MANKTLAIFPNDKVAQELIEKIRKKILIKSFIYGSLSWFVIYLIPAMSMDEKAFKEEEMQNKFGLYAVFLIFPDFNNYIFQN